MEKRSFPERICPTKGLPPVTGESPAVLILGSFPGIQSLRKKEYYGNPQNHFWKIMESLFTIGSDLSYDVKISRLVGYQIALWDVIHSCCRDGSADTRIRDPVFNDIAGFLKLHPTIRFIVMNGNSAGQYFHRMKITGSVHSEVLPSTSPANTHCSLSEKIRRWKIIRMKAIPE
jgi:TDG/mug DNA glycosylase family protein